MLDVGCALGYYTKAFYLKGFEAYGLDYSDVAIERAKNLHPECRFIHADGFNPETGIKYDLIFCKGFSGANTHDLSFVAGWVEKYMKLLKPGGKFIFSYSSDFSGNEKDGETVNWTKQELHDFAVMINSRSYIVKHFHRYYFISQIFSALVGYLRKKKLKRYFYIIFSGE